MVVVDRDPSDTKEYSGVTCYFTDPDNVTYTVLDDGMSGWFISALLYS